MEKLTGGEGSRVVVVGGEQCVQCAGYSVSLLLGLRLVLARVTSNGRPSLLILREGPVTGAAGNGGPCSSSFSGSWLMLGEACQVPLFLHHAGPLRPQEKQE